MCAYWLYILKHELNAEGCTLALSVSPTERHVNGRLQTAASTIAVGLLVVLLLMHVGALGSIYAMLKRRLGSKS